MNTILRSLLLCSATHASLSSASAQKFTVLTDTAGVEAAYRWSFPRSGPPELLLRLTNNSREARTMLLGLDVTRDLLTTQELRVDTCIRAAQVLNGKLNGFWFVPEGVDRAGIEGGSIGVVLTELAIDPVERCGTRGNGSQ